MINKLFNIILDNVVDPKELGDNWILFEIIAIILAVLPWIVLIIYLLFFKKYYVSYYVNEKLLYKMKYKKGETIVNYVYQNENILIDKWYTDEECTNLFNVETMQNYNIKLFAIVEEVNND